MDRRPIERVCRMGSYQLSAGAGLGCGASTAGQRFGSATGSGLRAPLLQGRMPARQPQVQAPRTRLILQLGQFSMSDLLSAWRRAAVPGVSRARWHPPPFPGRQVFRSLAGAAAADGQLQHILLHQAGSAITTLGMIFTLLAGPTPAHRARAHQRRFCR
jgi:hypothetical protein